MHVTAAIDNRGNRDSACVVCDASPAFYAAGRTRSTLIRSKPDSAARQGQGAALHVYTHLCQVRARTAPCLARLPIISDSSSSLSSLTSSPPPRDRRSSLLQQPLLSAAWWLSVSVSIPATEGIPSAASSSPSVVKPPCSACSPPPPPPASDVAVDLARLERRPAPFSY